MQAAPARDGDDDQEDEDEVSFSGVPLFEQPQGEKGERITQISVIRMEPIEEGHIGYLEPNAAEEDISRRFGGGLYRLQAKTAMGKPVRGGFRTVKIGGEPKFSSAFSQKRWNRIKRQETGADDHEEGTGRREPSMVELWELQEKKADLLRAQAKEEFDRRELERESAHKREMERLRIEAEARERDRQAAEERRERDRMLADERRGRDYEESKQRDREFHATLLQMQAEHSKRGGLGSTLELLAAAKELFSSGGDGGGGGDPVTALVQNLPAILDRSSSIASSISEAGAAARPPAANPGGPEVKLTGAHAAQLIRVSEHLRKQGIDPDRTLLRMLGAMGRLKKPEPEQAQGEPAGQPGEPAAEGAEEQAEQGESSAPVDLAERRRRARVNVRRAQRPRRR